MSTRRKKWVVEWVTCFLLAFLGGRIAHTQGLNDGWFLPGESLGLLIAGIGSLIAVGFYLRINSTLDFQESKEDEGI